MLAITIFVPLLKLGSGFYHERFHYLSVIVSLFIENIYFQLFYDRSIIAKVGCKLFIIWGKNRFAFLSSADLTVCIVIFRDSC